MRLKDLIANFIDDDNDIENFGLWAFGEKYRNIRGGTEFMNNWNLLHGDLLFLVRDGDVTRDIKKMIHLWNEHKNVDS